MTTLNQRILIPTGPSAVWAIVSDLNNNPKWQSDCQSVSFLTSLRAGARVRWRYTSRQGDDYVVETTAWYDGLGYEYTFIDGAPFRESKGTLRLQEIAEGTIVSWTLNYEMAGVMPSVRNALSVRRHFEKTMVESLKALYSHVKATGAAALDHEARSLMRDAPDYEARASYVPRHPSNHEESESKPAFEPLITEPPVTEEDTRPNPAVSVTEPEPEAAPAQVEPAPPEPAAGAPALASDSGDARFRPPASTPTLPVQAEASEVETAAVTEEPEPEPEPQPEPESPVSSAPPPLPVVRPSDTEQLPIVARDRFGPKLDTSDLDTKDISIWEVFNVPRPSDSQRLPAVQEGQHIAAADALESESVEKALGADVEVDEADTPVPELNVSPALREMARPAHAQVIVEAVGPFFGFRFLARRRLVRLRRRQ